MAAFTPAPSLPCAASSSVSLADAVVPPRGRLVELLQQEQGQLLRCHCSSTTSAPVLPPSLPRRAFTRAHLPPMPAVPGHQRPAGLATPANRTCAIVAVHSYSMRSDPSPVHRSTVHAPSSSNISTSYH